MGIICIRGRLPAYCADRRDQCQNRRGCTRQEIVELKQWRSKGGHAPRGAGLGGAPAHFLQSFTNAF